MQQKNYIYTLGFRVRDYECDIQGIVNNSVYQNYLEHTRHEFLIERGIGFAELHRSGIDLVVSRVEIDYRHPLKSGDSFSCGLNFSVEGPIRIVFQQDIFTNDSQHCISAVTTIVPVKNGNICLKLPSEINEALTPYELK